MAKPNPHAKVGSGGRFAALKAQVAGEKGIDSDEAGAIAASAGRKKYGAGKFNAMAQKGKR